MIVLNSIQEYDNLVKNLPMIGYDEVSSNFRSMFTLTNMDLYHPKININEVIFHRQLACLQDFFKETGKTNFLPIFIKRDLVNNRVTEYVNLGRIEYIERVDVVEYRCFYHLPMR